MQKLKEGYVNSLERQTDIAFAELKIAIATRNPLHVLWVKNLYSALGISLDRVTGTSNFNYMWWNRGTQRANLFDRYVLQYAIGSTAAEGLMRRTQPELKPHAEISDEDFGKGMDLVKKFIDTKKIGKHRTKYTAVSEMTQKLAEEGAFRLITGAMDYVRENYKKPEF